MNYNGEPGLSKIEKTTNLNGEVNGVRVRRSGYCVHYHRTDRNAHDILESTGGFNPVSISENRSVLDLGCGGGSLVQDLSNSSHRVHGLDLYLGDSQLQNPMFVLGDAYRLPFANQSLDLAFAFWSVFHYEPVFQYKRLLKEINRVLAPGGSLWINALHQDERLIQLNMACKPLHMTMQVHLQTGMVECIRTAR